MWFYFIVIMGLQNVILFKYCELINLVVVVQILCDYCIYFYMEVVKGYGVMEDEVKEVIVLVFVICVWSMII